MDLVPSLLRSKGATADVNLANYAGFRKVCLLNADDFQKLAKELYITHKVVEKRFRAGPTELAKFAPMQLRKVVDYCNTRFGKNEADIRKFREKPELLDWILSVAYSN